MTQEINSIRCKTCAAPLALLGNSLRSKTLTCQYCGTVMDCRNEFRALYSFSNVQQPQTNLRIGMVGKLEGVAFQISGFVVYRSVYRGNETNWLHFQCYSPTHGYSHIIIKDEECMVLRRTKYLPDRNIWMLKKSDQFEAQGHGFVIDQFCFPEVFYAAGNLTETISQRQRNKQCFASGDQQCFISVQRNSAVEYYSGVMMRPLDLEAAFGGQRYPR
jgi:hypothetical protein